MSAMRAALRTLRLLCALLASIALASAARAIAAGSHGAGTALAPRLSATSDPAVPASLEPQNRLLACPTTRDHVGRVVAAVMIDGKGPFRFIIDTGANQSTISPKLASALGLALSASQRIRVAGVTGTAIVPSVPIESLSAGALLITHARFPVISSPIMAGADGILGAAGLGEDSVFVDFQSNTVTIRRADEAPIPAGYAEMRATRLSGGLLSVPGYVGGVLVEAIIDTGSPQTLGNMALYGALYGHPRGGGKASVYGVTQQVRPGNVRIAPSVDLGAIRIDHAALVFGDFPIFKVWELTARPAIILGMDVLGTAAAFSIDFRRAEIRVAPQASDPSVHPGWTEVWGRGPTASILNHRTGSPSGAGRPAQT